MKQMQLIFSNNVILEDTRSMKLDYCLTENVMEADEKILYYGVKITRHLDDTIESDEATGISTSKEIAMSIIKKLYQFKVTPISMIEIVDELITQEV